MRSIMQSILSPIALQRALRPALIIAAVLCISAYGTHALAEPKSHTVVIEGMQFSPPTLEVHASDTVVWVNKDIVPHNVTAMDHQFASKQMAPNTSWTFKAVKKGTFPYICTLHPTMKGSLVVK
jgi:plastocyanin